MAPVDVHDDPFCSLCTGHDLSLYKKRTACRYFLAGNCRRGPNCPFAHVPVAAQPDTPTSSRLFYPEHMYAYHPLGPTPAYRPLDSQAYPVFLWKPYPVPPFDLTYGVVRQPPDYPDDKSDPSSPESSTTAASVDYQLRKAHETSCLEGSESATSPPGDVGVNPSPGYPAYHLPVSPGVKPKHAPRDRASSLQGPMVPFPPSLPWQGESRKKPLAYKTKPCKFFAANGKCTSGEKCTFIHDSDSRERVEDAQTALSPPTEANLPPKPLNKYDEYRARDFYPITWRVIGGGVMMGGQRQICPAFASGQCKYGDDCKLAHETELETDLGFIELKTEPVEKADRSPRPHGKNAKRNRSRSQRPRSVKETPSDARSEHPASSHHGTKMERSKGSTSRDSPASPGHRRTRSFSMVLTSPPPLDTTPPNYAAEL